MTDGVKTFGYDSAGRSSTIRQGSNTVNNSYDGLGQRITKIVGGVTTVFVYDEAGHMIGEYDQNNVLQREYIWLQDRIIGMFSKDIPNTLLRVHTDHLATPRAVTQGDGVTKKVLWRFEGDAFGDVSPTHPTSTAFTLPVRMAGQYFDSEVGISYNYFRDYDPSVGRYVQSDPIGLQGGMNTYGYVGANALGAVDPLGLMSVVPKVIKLGVDLCKANPKSCGIIPPAAGGANRAHERIKQIKCQEECMKKHQCEVDDGDTRGLNKCNAGCVLPSVMDGKA